MRQTTSESSILFTNSEAMFDLPLCILFLQISQVINRLGVKWSKHYLGCENNFSTMPEGIAHIFFYIYNANETLANDCSKQQIAHLHEAIRDAMRLRGLAKDSVLNVTGDN